MWMKSECVSLCAVRFYFTAISPSPTRLLCLVIGLVQQWFSVQFVIFEVFLNKSDQVNMISYNITESPLIILTWSTSMFLTNLLSVKCYNTLQHQPQHTWFKICNINYHKSQPHCSHFGQNSALLNKQEEVCDNNLPGLCMWWCHPQEETNKHKATPLPFKETWVRNAKPNWSQHLCINTYQEIHK